MHEAQAKGQPIPERLRASLISRRLPTDDSAFININREEHRKIVGRGSKQHRDHNSSAAAALRIVPCASVCTPAGDDGTRSRRCGAGGTPVAGCVPEPANGHPKLNGVWQAMNTAHWNLEGGPARAVPELLRLGALFAVPPGQSVVEGGTIPYLPEALEQRDKNRRAGRRHPETKCYRAGIPRSTYMPYPFQIVQGDRDMMFVYEYATSSRPVRMANHLNPQEVLVDQWLGWSIGRWEGDTLVIDVFGRFATRGSIAPAIIRRHDGQGALHADDR